MSEQTEFAEEQLSTSIESGEVKMSEQTLDQHTQEDLVQQLSQRLAQLEEKTSTVITENEALKAKLAETETALNSTSHQAELFSTALAQQKRDQLKGQLVAEGIPPTMVEQAFSFAASLPQEIRLSDGAAASTEEQIAGLLRALPMDNRVKFGQVGQNFSTGTADQGVYDDIIQARLGDRK